jgi:hypothetical protein
MNFRKTYIVVPGVLFFIGCNTATKVVPIKDKKNNYSIIGHYQFFTTGNGFRCETIKHEFDFDTAQAGGFFLYHVFCLPFNGDSTGVSSSLKPFSMIGKWAYTKDSSTLRLVADNGKVIRLRIVNKVIIAFFDDHNKELPAEIFFSSSNSR